jgi:outer membrane protein assembly factor BamD (BamD/ComL family)
VIAYRDAAVLLFAAALAGCSGGSERMEDLEKAAVQVRPPDETLKWAVQQRDAGNYMPALQALTGLISRSTDPAIRETAHFERAVTFYKAGGFYESYHDFEGFILKFPQSERVTLAKQMEMKSALELARAGKSTFFGLTTTPTTGIDYLHDALRRYPREDFAADFCQKLGMFFYEREDYVRAQEEFGRVLEQYSDAPETVLALYMIGRTSERRHEKLSTFDSVDYDVRPLRDARRHYERFLEEADRMRKLPDPAKKWVDGILPTVKERLGSVYERLVRKQLKTAEYYDWKGLPWSAEPYYIGILQDEASFRKILPSFPVTRAAQRARVRLTELSKQ